MGKTYEGRHGNGFKDATAAAVEEYHRQEGTSGEHVTLKVVETQPGMKGATASASYKPATLETGLQVMVPQFIEAGTKIKVDTRDDSYLERA